MIQMEANKHEIETVDNFDNGNTRPTMDDKTEDDDDGGIVMKTKPDVSLASRPKYKWRGPSLGNKLLIAMPICHVFLSAIFTIFSYVYAYEKHGNSFIEGTIAFISDLGDKKPQSSLFTFGMVLTAFLSLGIVLTRYFQVKHFFVKYDGALNLASLLVGILFVLGKILTSCFQLSSQRETHFAGAAIYVLFASVYAVIQTLITYKNRTLFGKRVLILIVSRVLLTSGMVIGTVLFLIFLHPDLLKYNKNGLAVSQGSEWFFAVCKMLFMLTFVADFWYLHPRWLLIKPNNEIVSELVLSNLNCENGTTPVRKPELNNQVDLHTIHE